MHWLILISFLVWNHSAGQLLGYGDDEDLSGSLVAFDTSTENYTVSVSSKCVFTCYVAEVRSFKVLWQKIDRTTIVGNGSVGQHQQEQLTLIAFDGVVYSNKDHYRLESDYVGSYNLIIDRVNEDDQGEYQCQINTEPRKTKRIFLTVQVPPRITEFRPNPPLISIVSGTSLTLLCRAEGTPAPHIRWRIRDIDVNNRIDSSPPENSNIWLIPSVNRSFPRTVECIADNGVLPASNRIFTIHVEFPPVVIIDNDLIQSQLHQNVTLECLIVSRPQANVSWEKNGRRIDEKHMQTIQMNETMRLNRLQIQMTNDDDFGQYKCCADNVHGRMEAIVFVLKETVVTSPAITTKKFYRHTKIHAKKKSHRLTTSHVHIERDISISSSSADRRTSFRWRTLSLFFLLIYR